MPFLALDLLRVIKFLPDEWSSLILEPSECLLRAFFLAPPARENKNRDRLFYVSPLFCLCAVESLTEWVQLPYEGYCPLGLYQILINKHSEQPQYNVQDFYAQTIYFSTIDF
jgi:hypothetical protein